MAEIIKDKLYQVAIGNRWNYTFVHAKDDEELIRFLVENYPNKRDLYGATEFHKDGTSRTVKLISNPLFDELYAQKAEESSPLLPAGITIINNKPWAVMLPTAAVNPASPDQWEEFMAVTKEDDNLSNCFDMASWCQEESSEQVNSCTRCGRSISDHWSWEGSGSIRKADIGYRPVLLPLDPKTFEPRTSIFLGRKDGDVFRMGSLYMDGVPQQNPKNPTSIGDIPDYIPGAKLCIGDSSHDLQDRITWIKVGDVLIADRNLMKNISWDDLNDIDLVRGPVHLQHEKEIVDKTSLDDQILSASIRASNLSSVVKAPGKAISPER